jgi:putative acetyltransferase
MDIQIRLDDLTGDAIAAFLQQHIDDMLAVSPPESKHALDINGLQQADVSFWIAWDGKQIAGCAALKEHTSDQGEIKSMRTSADYRGKGVGSQLVEHLLREAALRGYKQLNLETGSMDFFKPARQLYLKHGFQLCGPFADYAEDPNSVFMTRQIN